MKILFNRVLFTVLTVTIFSTIIIFYPGCASKGNPGGGPADRTPPEVIYTFPKSDSVNVRSLNSIQIHFSEPINESSIVNNIFTSPPIKYDVEWVSDSELYITLKDSLKHNQTYVLVIGAKVMDIRNNKLSSSYQLAFSTGNKIDRGSISGKVFGIDKNESYSIFAYLIKTDLTNFDSIMPDYISQTGQNNTYVVNYLQDGLYRLLAVNDQNNNLFIDANTEKLGIPYIDVKIDSFLQSFENLNFRTTKIDTTVPRLSYIRSVNSNQVNLNFSEKVHIDSLNQIEIRDSISSKRIGILTTSESIEADNVLEVYTSRMDSGNTYLCNVRNMSDILGNTSPDTTLSFSARGFSQPDTFKIISFTPADSATKVHPNSAIYIEFSNPIDKNSLENSFKITSFDSLIVKGHVSYSSAFEMEFVPDQPYTLDRYYNIFLDLKYTRSIWGDSLGDSIHTRSFKINNGDDYGEISGTVRFNDGPAFNTFIQAEKEKSKSEHYSTWITNGNKYIIKNVPDGIYRLNAFFDMDSNYVFNAGSLFPFKYSEPFIIREDTVKVRKRWESSDVDFSYPVNNN